jgi:phosphoribosylformylglycinamidine synthase
MLNTPVVGGNVSLYNESDEFNSQIKPTPSIGMVGRCRMRCAPAGIPEGMGIALAGTTGPHFGGSILDVTTRCGGEAPPVADHRILTVIRSKADAGDFAGVTDLSQGGLLAAMAHLTPRATVQLGGDALQELFSETYGRFLIVYRDEDSLSGLDYRIIGETGGECLDITCGKTHVRILPDEMEKARSSLTAIMSFSP